MLGICSEKVISILTLPAWATLSMMARWDLNLLQRSLKQLDTPLVLVAAGRDRTIAPADANRVQRFCPSARVRPLPGLGHLAHEENPEAVQAIILETAREFAVLAGPDAGPVPN